MSNDDLELNNCDGCGNATASESRPCAGCSVDVHVCAPCVASQLQETSDGAEPTAYRCSLCRTLRNLDEGPELPMPEPDADLDEDAVIEYSGDEEDLALEGAEVVDDGGEA